LRTLTGSRKELRDMGRKSKQDEAADRFVELRAQGKTYEEISRELNVDETTLLEWSKDRSLEIQNLQAIRYEAIQDRAYATKARQLELIGARIEAIREELDKRSLEDMDTKDLEGLLLKYLALLEERREAVRFTIQDGEFEFQKATWQG